MGVKHVAIVTSYPIPAEAVVYNRLSAFVRVLSQHGWIVTVLSAVPENEHTKFQGKAPDWNLVYVPVGDYDRRNFLVRGINELKLSRRLLRRAAELQPDVLVITIPSIFLLQFAVQRFTFPVVIDIRDLVWDYLPYSPWWKGMVRRLLRAGAIWALSRSDVISFANPHQLDHIKTVLPSMELLLVSNGIGREQFGYIRNLAPEPSQDKVLRITYLGNVGLAQNLVTLIEAVAGIDSLQVNVVGAGTDLPRIREAVEHFGATNVRLHGSMPWEDAVRWYARTDVAYAQLASNFASAIPSKLYEYLAAGLPVIYGGTGAAVAALSAFKGVTVVPPDSPQELRQALLDMLAAGNRDRQDANIELIARNYIREDQVDSIERVLSRLNEAT